MSLRVIVALVSLGAFAGAAAAACVDTTPFYVAPPDAAAPPPPPPPVDGGGPDAPDVYVPLTCQQCIESPDTPGPGCADELAICLVDQKCKDTYDCILRQGCLTLGSQKKVIICGLPCAAEAGIQSQFEQAANEIYNVAACAVASCPGPCKIGDGGAD